jgi:DNA polymerase-4
VPVEPGILHADLDSFYASVEQRDDPSLRGRPVIVGAGVVLAASYEAKARGVRTAMSSYQATRLCPDAIVVPPRMDAYSAASKAVFAVFADTSPLVEPVSIDEAFLDVRGLGAVSGPPSQIAQSLRAAVRDRVGLAITVGIARTKFLAKVASAVAKPDGLLVVPFGGELAFLHPLPIERLWGVGRVTAQKLHDRGVWTVADIAVLDERALIAMIGLGSGRHLHALAHDRDPRPVVTGRRRRSIGAQSALGRRRLSAPELDTRLIGLVDRVCRRLRAANRLCRTVMLRMRFEDFTRSTRSHTLGGPTADTAPILAALRTLVASAGPLISANGITLIGVTLANLDAADAIQLELPFGRRDARALDGVLDQVRGKYGTASISRGVLLHVDPGLSVPLLPD